MNINTKVLGALLIAALTFVPRAGATEILTTTYSAWLSNTSGAVTAWGGNYSTGTTFNTASGFSMPVGSFGPVTVTGPDGAGYNLSKYYDLAANSAIALVAANDGTGTMAFSTQPAGLTAFDFFLGVNGTPAPITITLSDGEAFTVNVSGAMTSFGFSSATAITGITLSTTAGSQIALVDFVAGNTNQAGAPAAEVATALMIGSGLLIFGGARKVFSNISTARA